MKNKTKTRQTKKKPIKKQVHKQAKLCVLPRKANDYQPYLIRRYGLAVVMILVIGVQLFYNLNTTGSILGEKATISASSLLDETNKVRQEHNLEELALNEKLNTAAQLKVQDMFDKQYWGHDGPDGTKPWKWFSEADYSYAEAGENLAKNFHTTEATMLAWMNSPDHRDNVLGEGYTEVGFAVASDRLDGRPATLIVALYGQPASSGATVVNTAVAGATGSSISFLARIGIGVQSVTPAALGSIVILMLVMMVAVIAHLYRDHIPKKLRKKVGYRHHHGAIKLGGALALIMMILLVYSGGQI